jgi:hypothetical protein
MAAKKSKKTEAPATSPAAGSPPAATAFTVGQQKVLSLLTGVLSNRAATLGELQTALAAVGEDAGAVLQGLQARGLVVPAAGGVMAARDAAGNFCVMSGNPPAASGTPEQAPPPPPPAQVPPPAAVAHVPESHPWEESAEEEEEGGDDLSEALLEKMEEQTELLKRICTLLERTPAAAQAPAAPGLQSWPPAVAAPPLPPPPPTQGMAPPPPPAQVAQQAMPPPVFNVQAQFPQAGQFQAPMMAQVPPGYMMTPQGIVPMQMQQQPQQMQTMANGGGQVAAWVPPGAPR